MTAPRRRPTAAPRTTSRRRARLAGLAAAGAAALLGPAASVLAAPASDTVLVRIDSDATRSERSDIARRLDADGVVSLPGGWREYRLDDALTAAEARRELQGAGAVDDVRLPQRVRLVAADDPYLASGQQWGLRNTATPGVDVDALGAWPLMGAAQPVTVAVVDTGVQTGHPELAGRVWTNPGEIPGNGVDDDANGFVDDVEGWDFSTDDATVYDDPTADRHGTHVAGVIAARTGDGQGMAGIAPGARIMSLKFIGAGGSGWNSDAVRAIQYAVQGGARVVNASFGGSGYDPVLCDAIAWAAQRGTIVVAAAGNNGQNLDTTGMWPARCAEPTMLTVVAVTSGGGLASFSNRSATHTDVGAPGQGILSLVPNGYALMSGTSMATPHVAGAAAAVLGESPGLSPAQVRAAILAGGRPLPSLAGTTSSGRMLDLRGALASAPGAPADTTPPAPFALAAPAPAAATAQPRPAFAWSAPADGAVLYRLRIDGAVAATTGATSAAPAADLPEGAHVWSVDALDGAGNVRASEQRTLTVDRTAPSPPALTSPARGDTPPAGTLTVHWTPGSDAGAGLAAHEVVVDGAVVARTGPAATSAPITLGAGVRTVTVRAVDRAGNARAAAAVTVAVANRVRTPAPRVVVAPRPVRIGRRTVVRVRATRPARVTLVVGTGAGRRVGTVRALLPTGASAVVLPPRVVRAAGARPTVGLATVRLALPR